MKNLPNVKITSWVIAIISFVVYVSCLPQNITFWDSPEFAASCYTLQNSHPPGSPLYMLIGSLLTGIFGNVNIAFVTNIMSSFFAALTIKLLFDVIYFIATKILSNQNKQPVAIVASIVGSLSYAFCYSFWTAATETEVYTLSFFLLILICCIALNWLETTSEKKEQKYVLLIFLLLGLSVGVHLINIAIIFPLTLLFFYKKIAFKLQHILLALLSGIILFFFLFNVIFQGIINVSYKTDFYFVNNLSLPVNYGALFCFTFITVLFLGIALLAQQKQSKAIHYSFLALFFFIIGCSSYLTPLLRSQINAPISNTVKTALNLQSYVRAEQFGVGKIPLVKGSVYNAPLDNETPFLNAPPKYNYDENSKKYVVINDGIKSIENYDNRFDLFFPRVYHKNEVNSTGYKTWTTIKGASIEVNINNKPTKLKKPRFHENLSFFFNYQVNWLYLRYLFKNFIGNQNNLKGIGNITKGNWKSGFNFMDKNRLGDDTLIPEYYKNLNSNDFYFYFPFLLGCIGLYNLRKHKLFFLTTVLLFITFGLGITLYVNPVPQSILIRERDYIFTASFMFFSIWIGLSVINIFNFFNKKINYKYSISLTLVLCLLIAPLQLLYKGYDNHNRKKEFFAYELGKAYLKDCPEQAILITNTDNFTFPLWYLQEVENFRTDVRVVNYDQLLLSWYVEKLKVKTNTSLPIQTTISSSFNASKENLTIPLKKQTDKFLNINNIAQFLNSSASKLTWQEKEFFMLPTDNFLLPVTTSVKNIALKDKFKASMLDTLRWAFTKKEYQKNDLILYDIIASNINERPICFAETGEKNYYGLSDFLVNKGMFYQLLPLKRNTPNNNPKIIDTHLAYKSLIENTPFTKLDDINSKVTDESIGISRKIIRRNSYFLAQAFLEEKDTVKALKTIDHILNITPNKNIPFHEYAFSLGKLYYRANNIQKGNTVCATAIENLENEIKWISSFNPPRPIINVRYLNYKFKIYEGMIFQLQKIDPDMFKSKQETLIKLQHHIKNWQKSNWPY